MGIFDSILALYLIVFLPARQLWKSFHQSKAARNSRAQRYLKSMVEISIPLLILATDWVWLGRSPAALGLDLPVSTAGLWGLGVAALLLLGLGVAGPIWERKLDDRKRAAYLVQIQGNDSLPRTRVELRIFLVMALLLGTGWELLYRGLLLAALPPLTGTAGAVILSAIAYGLAHGYENPKQLAASIVSAFVFTIGFVLTQSLWWLMLAHVGLAMLGPISCYKTLASQAKVIPALPLDDVVSP
jgi:membrane protease YdiL (CAAX protease family)